MAAPHASSRLGGAGRGGFRDWLAALAVYRQRQVLLMVLFGIASGLPFGVLAEPLTAWLTDAGVSKTDIGLFALVSLPYSLKFLWAPAIDGLRLPLLTRFLGHRRGWALATQLALLAALSGLGLTDPALDLGTTALVATLAALASASQDVVVDAYRVESLDEPQYAAGAATMVFGWRLGQVGAGALGLVLADLLPWATVLPILAGGIAFGIVGVLISAEPQPAIASGQSTIPGAKGRERRRRLRAAAGIGAFAVALSLAGLLLRAFAGFPAAAVLPAYIAGGALLVASLVVAVDAASGFAHPAANWLYQAAFRPILDFLGRPAWLPVLLFIMLYKFGDAVLSVMKVPFFLELGFTKTEIAEVVKLFGVAATITGGFLGGWLMARLGLMIGLLVCGALMAASNLMFVVQSWAGADMTVLAATIAVENVTTGMGTTAFVAYLSSLCNLAYTATQYALLTSLMALSRTVLSSGAGWLADQLDWPTFFAVTTLAALPGLALLLLLMRWYPAAGRMPAGTVEQA